MDPSTPYCGELASPGWFQTTLSMYEPPCPSSFTVYPDTDVTLAA